MIARFRVLLPFRVLMPIGDKYEAVEVESGPYRGIVCPPYQAAVAREAADPLSDVPLSDLSAGLEPANPQLSHAGVTMDGSPTIFANALQIEVRQSEFDRSPGQGGDSREGDALALWFFEVGNSVLGRLRTVMQDPDIKTMSPEHSIWEVAYSEDDGSPPKRVEGKLLVQWRGGFSFHVVLPGMNAETWTRAMGAGGVRKAPVWETLQLDAESMYPEIGPAIVLAATAVETAAERVLRELAPANGVPGELWDWINNEKKLGRPPSIAEQLDVMLRILSGRSLKDDRELWEAFQNLRGARNSFVHEGSAKVGGRAIDSDMASKLVGGARKILEWLDPMLAPEDRRIPPGRPIKYQTTRTAVKGGEA